MTAPKPVRFVLRLHYDGASFHGWQLQPEAPTVQGTLEAVLTRLHGGTRVPVTGSGRTDRGVHATGQVATVDLPPRWTAVQLRRSLNALLPRTVWVERVARAPDGFHPRFDALRRTYHYRIGTSEATLSPFLRPTCWNVSRRPPDPGLLREAAALLPGERSFRAFARAGQEERGDRCHLFEARWRPWTGGEGEPLGWSFLVTANRYLHHMVRYLVGTQVAVARRDRPLHDLAALLEAPAGGLVTSPPAPPEGLFLARVEYERDPFDPAATSEPRGPDTAARSPSPQLPLP